MTPPKGVEINKQWTAYWLIVAFCWGCVIFLSPAQGEPPEMEFWMTGFSAEEGFTPEGSRTSNGTVVGYGTVAVDPSVVPYGSIIYWKEYSDTTPGNHYGVALDCGSAVVKSHLDWWYLTNAEAYRMTKTATVLILREGWSDWKVDPARWGLQP